MLIPIHETTLTLPEFAPLRKNIGGNIVLQIAAPPETFNCKIFLYDKSCYLARSDNGAEVFIAAPRVRKEPPQCKPVLRTASAFGNVSEITSATLLKWVQHPSQHWPKDPAGVASSWADQFRFVEERNGGDRPGLRRPQLGALHAIAAHLLVGKDPATVVMPTGTGKTETMLAALVYRQCEKVLVLVPSDALRMQTFRKFITLGHLPSFQIVPPGLPRPIVALLKKGLSDLALTEELAASANVFVATPNVLASFSAEARSRLIEGCTHLFVDEAHHVSARTWREVKEAFKGKPILQFTATPFRQDGRSIEGNIVFNYTMGEAQRDGYFRSIRLMQVEEFDDRLADRAICRRAVRVLRDDLDAGFDHLLMARTSRIGRAEDVLQLYEKEAPDLKPRLVHSQLKRSDREAVLQAIRSREGRAVVCVDMLGEGFDLPNLKIAALHDTHKSLGITLQFVGRFTRSTAGVGEAAVVVNTADQKVHEDLQALYAERACWDEILSYTSETKIAKEINLQKLVERCRAGGGNLGSEISLWNLRPSFSMMVYRTACLDWAPLAFASVLQERCNHWYAHSPEDNLIVAVVAREEEVKWGRYKDIKDATFELLVAHWDKDRRALFLNCSDYDFFRCQRLAEALCGDHTEAVVGKDVCRVFANVERPLVRNLGASQAGTISFTMYFGPNVTDGLTQVERNDSELNNLTGWGYEDGKRVSWGCSQKKGKVWSITGGPITEWLDWCRDAWDKIHDDSLAEVDIVAGFLRPVRIPERPPLAPLYVEWGDKVLSEQEARVGIWFGDSEYRLHEVDLALANHEEAGPLSILFRAEDKKAVYDLEIDAGHVRGWEYLHRSGPPVEIRLGGGQRRSLSEFMVNDPVSFHYVGGSFSHNNYLVQVPEEHLLFNPDGIEVLDWTGTDIHAEIQDQERKPESVQYRIAQEIRGAYEVLLDDHGPDEAADIIAIRKESDTELRICLVHCKGCPGAKSPGARVKDMYEVCGQAQKSIRWKHNRFSYLVDHLRVREAKWQSSNHTRYMKGSPRDLVNFQRFARVADVKLEVLIVHPGLSKAQVKPGDAIAKLLASTELFLKKTANATLRVIASP